MTLKAREPVQAELGEVRLPVFGGRSLIYVFEESSRERAIDSAKWKLAEHTKESRGRYARRFWDLIRDNTRIYYMANLELINHTALATEWVQHAVHHLCRELLPRQTVRFVFQDSWKDIDEETGELIVLTESHDIRWEGDFWKMKVGGLVRIRLSSHTVYPVALAIKANPSSPHRSLDLYLESPKELFLFLAALQLRRLWQMEHPRKFAKACKDLGLTAELDADLYAARMLNAYRQNSAQFIKQMK